MWTQEYEDYINKSPVWQDKRHRVVVVRAGGRCEQLTPDGRCTARAVHCHHLHYRNLFHERLEDLQALCETHHRAAHVWEKNPRCRYCRRRVFDDMEAVLGFVEQNEDLSWDELYDELPTACRTVRGRQVRGRPGPLQRPGRSTERTPSAGPKNEDTHADQQQGQRRRIVDRRRRRPGRPGRPTRRGAGQDQGPDHLDPVAGHGSDDGREGRQVGVPRERPAQQHRREGEPQELDAARGQDHQEYHR